MQLITKLQKWMKMRPLKLLKRKSIDSFRKQLKMVNQSNIMTNCFLPVFCPVNRRQTTSTSLALLPCGVISCSDKYFPIVKDFHHKGCINRVATVTNSIYSQHNSKEHNYTVEKIKQSIFWRVKMTKNQ